MADIELVIKIDNQTYNNFVNNEYSRNDVIAMHTALVNGTPLPKNHGDLIDRKDLIENGMHKGFCDWYDEIKYADTIIEADKAESEE